MWIMIPFCFTNAPRTFMRLINHVLKPFINRFVVLYLDDILVYNKTIEEYVGYLQQVFDVLLWERLFDYLKKIHFMLKRWYSWGLYE